MNPIEWLMGLFKPPTLDQRVNAAYIPNIWKGHSSNENTAAQRGVPQWMDSLFRSPTADSAYKVTGVPEFMGALPQESRTYGLGTVRGEYVPGFDNLMMNPNPAVYEPGDQRNVFLHEMGHKYSRDTNANPGVAFNPTNVMGLLESAYAKSSPKKKASLALDEYYKESPIEGYAQAFVNAWNYLDKTKDPKVDYRKLAGEMEANTPGMGQIIENLLQLDLFHNHPLRGKAFTTKKK